MKLVITKSLGLTCLLFLIAGFAALTAQAQDVKLQLSNLDKLEARASESVDVSLDGALLRLAISVLKSSDPEERAIKEAVAGIKGVYVKSFEFEKEGEYSVADIDPIRTQLRSPGWSRMVGVKSKKEGDNVEVYTMMTTDGQISAMTVITTEPKELTVVNIVGMIDLEKLSKLSGKFGIPSLDLKNITREPKE